ncbi:hypothetical protein MTO96_035672 [Rhipicephalus appendiculatus]
MQVVPGGNVVPLLIARVATTHQKSQHFCRQCLDINVRRPELLTRRGERNEVLADDAVVSSPTWRVRDEAEKQLRHQADDLLPLGMTQQSKTPTAAKF